MSRIRYQRGSVRARFGSWLGQYWEYRRGPDGRETRRHREVVLGPQREMTLTMAKKALAVVIELEADARPDGALTVADFIEGVWLPSAEARWRDTTSATNKGLLKNQVLRGLGKTPLDQVSLGLLQSHINELASAGRSYSVLQHTCSLLRQAFDYAVENQYLMRDPARKLRIPKASRYRYDPLAGPDGEGDMVLRGRAGLP